MNKEFEQNINTSTQRLRRRTLDINPLLSNSHARVHLNDSPETYYRIINRNDSEDFKEYVDKMRPLQKYLQKPQSIVSVGVGSGLELHALRTLFPSEDTEIIGLDLSDKALNLAKKYLNKKNVKSNLIQGSATDMPFIKEGIHVDGIVFSSLLHEVYSYVPDGRTAWKKAISEAADNLSDNGALLIRDFAAPTFKGDVKLIFKTEEALSFYNYFRERYKTYVTWSNSSRNLMMDRRVNKNDFPEIASEGVTLSFDKISEYSLHLRNYINALNNNLIKKNEKSWKEIDETYLIPNPDNSTNDAMSPSEYKNKVLEVGNKSISLGGYELVCLEANIVDRDSTANFMKEHIQLKKDGVTDENILFKQIPPKMEYVFKKVKVK